MLLCCYVRGCRTSTVLCANHKTFGHVASCPDHDPIQHAYAVPFAAVPAVTEAQGRDKPNLGPMAALLPRPTTRPPEGQRVSLTPPKPEIQF